jgi:hypothetical protein
MPPAVEELPSGESPRSGRSQGVYDRQSRRRVCKIDFAQLDGLSARADQELRETEDALVSFMEQQAKRDRLYVKSQDELKEQYHFGRMDGAA